MAKQVLLKAAQLNIGGGRVREPGSDPRTEASYPHEDLEAIIAALRKRDADIITLQETHTRGGFSHTQLIAEALGLPYWVNDPYGDSHIQNGYQLGQAIISRYPITAHQFEPFANPEWPGNSHTKGVTTADLAVDKGGVLQVKTLHGVQFKRFGVEPLSEVGAPVLEDMQVTISSGIRRQTLLQGDFNLDDPSIREFLPQLFKQGFTEVVQAAPTTPGGRRVDHALFLGLKMVKSTVISTVETDHYLLENEFAISEA